ncbi:MAG: hypothetical protein KKF41_06280 [Actinobacteria bacterium]|nr:hypothetical protein [Actinomycetota bacterium]MBU1942057.1 hypothetical protein [Actinomycetota bacterium]MBU2687172.1 hypothetical protein [Actinomycetota bacterium]
MEEKGQGWLAFASVMMMLAGIANFVWGITAIARDELLPGDLLFANLTFWGIVFMALGVVLFAAGVAVLNRAEWAALFGIIFCSLSIVFYFFVIWAYPVWSVLVIAIDVLVIYALATYGGLPLKEE